MSKTIAQLQQASLPISRRSLIEISQLAASKKAMLCQTSGRVELVSYLPDGYVMDGSVNYASLLNSAIEAALVGVRVLVLPEFPVRIDTQIAYSGVLSVVGSHGPNFAQEEASELIWGGAPGALMVKLTLTNRGGWSGVTLNGDGIAGSCMKLDGCQRGEYADLNLTGFTGAYGLQLTGEAEKCMLNDFIRLQMNATAYTGAGDAGCCIWLGRTTGTPGAANACHNRFYGPEVQHEGLRHGWHIGNCDNNTIYSPLTLRATGTGRGFNIDPTEAANMPSGNEIFHMQAGPGGYVHAAATTISPGTIWGYQTDNAQPVPVLTGVPTRVYMQFGAAVENLTLANGWVNYGGGAQTAVYTKDPLGWVEVLGYIKDGTDADTTNMGTLPAGFRPVLDQVFVVASGSGAGIVTVKANGQILISAGGDNAGLSLNGIRFIAA